MLGMQKRLLVVDDEDSIREVAQVSLEVVGGCDVTTAESGAQALTTAHGQQLDAILLDVMMPEMDGPATLRLLQSDVATRDIPVILLTAKVQPNDRNRLAATPGVRGVIAKPFDPMLLPAQVASMLGWETPAAVGSSGTPG
jgi:CheY-like chemotaxis protein